MIKLKNLFVKATHYSLSAEDNPLTRFLKGMDTSSNKVKGKEYKTSPWIYANINVWMRLSQIPWNLITADDKANIITSGAEYYLIKHPNSEMTQDELKEYTAQMLGLHGEAFFYVGNGSVVSSFIPIDPLTMTITKKNLDTNNNLISWTRRVNGKDTIHPKEEVLHIKLPNPYDHNRGQSPITALRLTIDADYAARLHNKVQMANRGRIEGIISYDEEYTSSELTKLGNMFNKMFGGADNAGKWAHLSKIKDIKQLSQSMKDLDWLQGMKLGREEICAVFGVPPVMVGILDRATFCLPADSLISTPNGLERIIDIKEGDMVLSEDRGSVVTREVEWSGKVGHKQIFEIKTRNNTLKATGNHPVMARVRPSDNEGEGVGYDWKRVDELTIDDKLVQFLADSEPSDVLDILPDGKDYKEAGLKDFRFAEIISIKALGEVDVYDISVEGSHRFIADGILVHNSNFEQADKDLWNNTLIPLDKKITSKFEQAIVKKKSMLLTSNYDSVPAMRVDQEKKIKNYTELVNRGYMSPTAASKMTNVDLGVHEDAHDQIWIPFSVTTADDYNAPMPSLEPIPDPTPEPPSTEEIEASIKKDMETKKDINGLRTYLWRGLTSQHTRREQLYSKELKKYFYNQRSEVLGNFAKLHDTIKNYNITKADKLPLSPDKLTMILMGLTKWDDELTKRSARHLDSMCKQGANSILETMAVSSKYDANIMTTFRLNQNRLLAKVNATTAKEITLTSKILEQAILRGDNIVEAADAMENSLKGVFKKTEARRHMIARTEINRSYNGARTQQSKEAGIRNKEWLSARDSEVRDEHADLDGEVVDIDGVFSNGESYPSSINCRCTILPVIQ